MFKLKSANVTRLSPLRRGFLIGYRRARAEMQSIAAHWEAEMRTCNTITTKLR